MVAAGMVELALRVGARKPDPSEYVAFRKAKTPGLSYEFVAGARVPWAGREIRINSLGFRGPEFAQIGNVWPRIAVIGDSIAAGYGLSEAEALPHRMAALMRERGLPGEVLGLGVPGYNIRHIAALWEERVVSFRPAAVVYALCLNDALPELELNSRGVLVAAGSVELEPERARTGRLPIPGKAWLLQHSLAYQLAVARYDLLLRRLGFRAEPLPRLDQVEKLYRDGPEAERFLAAFARLSTSVRLSGARLLVLCFPLADQLKDRDDRPQRALAPLVGELGVDFLDLDPAFLAAGGATPQALFDADGLHPNAAGHALSAGEALKTLEPWISAGQPRPR
jgi:lysophospholipase L1-like esterase